MTTQPVEANVVLTADNSQYDAAMDSSSQSTNNLGKSIDSLGTKINNLSKSAGRKLLGITAADVALITGATAAWSSYEKQMSRLQAQSAILTRTNEQQSRVMKDYTTAVKGLRTEYGTTTTEAAKLVETLSKVTSTRQTRDLQDLSKVFVDMALATGESSDGLASSLANLQKIMGTPINSKNTRNYADQFTYLAASTNTTAQSLIDFTAQLAPVGEQLGLSQTQLAGFATAFTRAGQDGYAAATVFTRITSDITKSMQTGSPEIAKYANLIGVTQAEFKKMEGGEQVVRILESLQELGPRAASELNRLGLDSIRSMRAVTAVINQPGGVRQAIYQAQEGYGSGSAAEGAANARKGLSDELDKLRQSLMQTAEAMASWLGPITEEFVAGMVKASDVVTKMVEGPFGKFLQLAMAIVAPLAGGAGALLLFAGSMLKVAAAFAAVRNSLSLGVREGFQGGAGITRLPDGSYAARGTGMLGVRGAQIAEGGSWFQRGMYNIGQAGGATAASGWGVIRQGWQQGRGFVDPNYVPQPRGIFSLAAGGIGRSMQFALTPQYEQMRYANPALRHVQLAQQSPWMGAVDRYRLSTAMGQVGAAGTGLLTAQAIQESVLGSQGASPEMKAKAKAEVAAAQERLATARASEAAVRDSIAATQSQTREVRNNTTGFTRLRQAVGGYVGGAVGAGVGGAAVGARMFAQSPMALPAAGMLGMAGMSAAGVQSNTLMLGAAGTMIMPGWGTAAGAGIGAALDLAQANDQVGDSIKYLNESATEASRTGVGLAELDTAYNESAEALDELRTKFGEDQGLNLFAEPNFSIKTALGAYKNRIEGWFGSSDIEELEDQQSRAQASLNATEGAVRDLGEAVGEQFTGTRAQQLKQMEEFMSTEGASRLTAAGVDLQALIVSRMLGGTKYQGLLDTIAAPGQTTGLWDRLTAGGGAGAAMVASPTARASIRFQSDVALFYKATNEVFTNMREQGMSYLQILKSAEVAQQTIGTENQREYELQMAIAQKAQQFLGIQAQAGTRVEAFQGTMAQLQLYQGIEPRTEEQAAQLEQMRGNAELAIAEQEKYFEQLLLQQDQYELSRSRAQEDYNLQRRYSEFDYQLSRERAEEQYNRTRERATADYYRSVNRAQYDFQLSRERQEQDFNHQVTVMAKQQAISTMDIYQRVPTQRTSSASWLLSNAGDQLARLREMEKNLNKLRRLGFSDAVIQQLRLTDPANAQQLERFVTEVQDNPNMVRQFNRVVGRDRLAAVRNIITDESSLEWAEMIRSYRLQRERAAEDFQRQMRLSRQDFMRGLNRQREDFDLMMGYQADDYERQVNRQEEAFSKSMNRSAEDLALQAKEIDMDLMEVLRSAVKNLSGHAQQQAEAVLQSFRNLRSKTTPEAVALMRELSDIFGFKYTPPKGYDPHPGRNPGGRQPQQEQEAGFGAANGAVVPGWTPGRDTRTAQVSGGEAIMRPEWTRAVGEKAIEAMNHQAKYGGFASGGVFWPVPGHRTSTYPGHDGVDINRGSGWTDMGDPIRAFRSGKIVYVGTGHGYGDAIFERTAAGTVVYGHTSAQFVHAGQRVAAGQMIGQVGNTGNSTAPHLHFGIPGGTTSQALALLAGAIMGGIGMGSGPTDISSLLKDRYPQAERAAAEMQGVHPLHPGDISTVINRFARRKIRELRRKGRELGVNAADIGDQPHENLTNQQIVHTGANRLGWGNQWPALYQLVMHESGFNNTAQNPTSSAYGMFQFLDGTWASVGGHKTSDPWLQTQYGLKYIAQRYGNPRHAWDFWQDNGWYGKGSLFTSPNRIGVGEHGPEAVIPLNARGGEFMADVLGMVMGGRNVTPAHGGMSIYNTRIDRSTNFTGPITVQANDPAELINKLRARQRVMALSRPSLTGSAA